MCELFVAGDFIHIIMCFDRTHPWSFPSLPRPAYHPRLLQTSCPLLGNNPQVPVGAALSLMGVGPSMGTWLTYDWSPSLSFKKTALFPLVLTSCSSTLLGLEGLCPHAGVLTGLILY